MLVKFRTVLPGFLGCSQYISTDLLQEVCDVVDPVVDDDPAVRAMVMPRNLVKRDNGRLIVCLLLLRNAMCRFTEVERRDGKAQSVSSQ
jgi:hypothetical protein